MSDDLSRRDCVSVLGCVLLWPFATGAARVRAEELRIPAMRFGCKAGRFVWPSCVLLVVAAACAENPDRDAAGDPDRIASLEHRVEEATRVGDVAFLDSVYAPTFRFKHWTGELEERAERLETLRVRTERVFTRALDSLDVEVHDDIALTTGRVHVRQEDEEPEWREYTIRYVRVYVRRHGRWQLLTHHTTGLTHGPPANR